METRHPGITYEHIVKDTPLSIHVVKTDPKLTRVIPVRAMNNGLGRECLTSMAERYDALAAINGGYFLVGGAFDGKSCGALKIEDRWFATPAIDCSSVAWMHDSLEVKMSRIAIAWKVTIGDKALPVDGLNIPIKRGKAILYSNAMHRSTLSSPGHKELLLKDDLLTACRTEGDSLIPPGGYVYCISREHPLYSHPFQVGMKAAISSHIGLLDERFEDAICTAEEKAFWQHADYIMSGAPLLLQNNHLTKEYLHDALKEFVMYAPHPRSAVGVTERGEWVFVVVEGRQPYVSHGIDVNGLGVLMHELGCVDALNLDGGASCLLLVEGAMANAPLFNGIEGPSHELGQRRISDGFLILPRR